jgi:hypothetical protein
VNATAASVRALAAAPGKERKFPLIQIKVPGQRPHSQRIMRDVEAFNFVAWAFGVLLPVAALIALFVFL